MRSSETSEYLWTTRRYNPEYRVAHIRPCDDLTSDTCYRGLIKQRTDLAESLTVHAFHYSVTRMSRYWAVLRHRKTVALTGYFLTDTDHQPRRSCKV
jgi:hypothetical protein